HVSCCVLAKENPVGICGISTANTQPRAPNFDCCWDSHSPWTLCNIVEQDEGWYSWSATMFGEVLNRCPVSPCRRIGSQPFEAHTRELARNDGWREQRDAAEEYPGFVKLSTCRSQHGMRRDGCSS